MFIPVAFSLGFLGSFHCMGMCGPIALALPLNRKNMFTMVVGSSAYNLGRVFTYSLIGLVFGLIGQGLFLAGYQNILSITLGVLILASLVLAGWAAKFNPNGLLYRMVNAVKSKLIPLFNKRSTGGLFLICLHGYNGSACNGICTERSNVYGLFWIRYFTCYDVGQPHERNGFR
jgi:sulfite exporter TauE/SafE